MSIGLVFPLEAMGRKLGRGATRACRASVPVILKHDSSEWPLSVLCEVIAQRLAAATGAPVVPGIATLGPLGIGFACLQVDPRSVAFSASSAEASRRLVQLDPQGCALLLALDALIGNDDRLGNTYAYRTSSGIRALGFDHSHALLQWGETPELSLEALSHPSTLRYHPFHALPSELLSTAIAHVQTNAKHAIDSLDDWMECFPFAHRHWGRRLQSALGLRLDHLDALGPLPRRVSKA